MIDIRPISEIPELHACEALQRLAFGYADIDIVPKNELISIIRSGGVVLGAFEGTAPRGDAPGEAALVGFCFGFVGRDHAAGALYHSSRMVAVDPDRRGRGIAYDLKMAQRAAVLAQGLVEIRWTYDPLALPNASLNLRKLGAVATGYVRDLYGATSSPLHARGTDRLTVSWLLDRPRIEAPPGAERIELGAGPDPADVRARFEDAFARGLVAVDFRDGAYLLTKV